MDIDRVVLIRYIDSWKDKRYLVERKGNDQVWWFPNLPNILNLVIEKTERIRLRNADRLVDCSDQQDAMIVSIVSSYGTCLGGQCLSA